MSVPIVRIVVYWAALLCGNDKNIDEKECQWELLKLCNNVPLQLIGLLVLSREYANICLM